MFDSLKDMGKLLKQAQEMKSKMKDVQKELKNTKVTGYAFNNKIEVIVNGEMEILSIKIDPSAYAPENTKNLEKNVQEAVSEAIKQAKDLETQKLSSITGGMNIPGLTG